MGGHVGLDNVTSPDFPVRATRAYFVSVPDSNTVALLPQERANRWPNQHAKWESESSKRRPEDESETRPSDSRSLLPDMLAALAKLGPTPGSGASIPSDQHPTGVEADAQQSLQQAIARPKARDNRSNWMQDCGEAGSLDISRPGSQPPIRQGTSCGPRSRTLKSESENSVVQTDSCIEKYRSLHEFSIHLCDTIRLMVQNSCNAEFGGYNPLVITHRVSRLSRELADWLLGPQSQQLLLNTDELSEIVNAFADLPRGNSPNPPFHFFHRPLSDFAAGAIQEIREALGKAEANRWLSSSNPIYSQLRSNPADLSTNCFLTAGWIQRCYETLRAMEKFDCLPRPTGSFPTPTDKGPFDVDEKELNKLRKMVEKMRQEIGRNKKGRRARRNSLITGLREKEHFKTEVAVRALRVLEAIGEFDGFDPARRGPASFTKEQLRLVDELRREKVDSEPNQASKSAVSEPNDPPLGRS